MDLEELREYAGELQDIIKSSDILCDVYVKEINRLEQKLKK